VALTGQLPALFSKHAATFEVGFGASLTPLFPEEAASVARAVEKRRWEFCAGRHCARRALAELGGATAAIVAAADRAPVWPDGFTGSITHTGADKHGYAAAVVARTSAVRSLGLDAELAEPLDPELQTRVLTPTEQAFVSTLEPGQRGLVATLFFSAKEAFYKCQYPVTQRFLGFHDVEVEFELERNCFRARLRSAPETHEASLLVGRFLMAERLIVTGVELPT
jgi:4'-phosphopantetheinyl transferase EntD